jgi:hypothetical protein
MTSTQCQICKHLDSLRNLREVLLSSGETALAHVRCFGWWHSKETNLRAFDASLFAEFIAGHNIDAADPAAVEQFLREREYPKDYFTGRRPNVAAIVKAARKTFATGGINGRAR